MRFLDRARILPEPELPDAKALIEEGRRIARRTAVGPSPFLSENGVPCEIAYKRRQAARGDIMRHAQFGFRDLDKSRRAYREIHERIARAGGNVDRYGICLDWSMGYPAAKRRDMPRGTGLVLEKPEDFAALTREAPVAPHFGDFVLGMPSAVENTEAALAAGSTTIGNLGQYFTFRLPLWHDDVATTAATLTALALAAAQPVEILIHSNLDDGFAALFDDMACALGAALVERYIVEELIGGHLGHCYGHTYSVPVTRLAFQRALAAVSKAPGTMVYGNTTVFSADEVENYASLAGYLLVDIAAQRTRPSGHAVNPVPVTEAERIPEIDEIVDAHRFCHRLIDRAEKLEPLLDLDVAEEAAAQIVEGGLRFKDSVLTGLDGAGIGTDDPFEMLLSLKRIGAKRLEALFGPGREDPTRPGRRAPIVGSATLRELESSAERTVAGLGEDARAAVRSLRLSGCIATTDVHEYGKILVETVFSLLGVRTVDGGVAADPDALAAAADEADVDFIAVSTYSGIALDYLKRLKREMAARGADIPVFIGGKLNQIPEDSVTSLPVDVSTELEASGAIVCRQVEDMLERLVAMAEARAQGKIGE